jgi:predicted HTH transcriptional regulator
MEGFKRIDIPEYSLEVLREAVINAVVHRDYSKRGESVRVFCYPDRVEVHSPGLLLPGITVEQMERGEVQSKLRNPVLAGLLKRWITSITMALLQMASIGNSRASQIERLPGIWKR